MEKKIWSMPEVQAVQFASDAYCSGCYSTETGLRSVFFQCNAGIKDYGMSVSGRHPTTNEPIGWIGLLYTENGLQPGLQVDGENADKQEVRYGACNITHGVEIVDPNVTLEDLGIFSAGYYLPAHKVYNEENGTYFDSTVNFDETKAIPVWFWRGESGTEWHATQDLITTWEYSKS
ncbi:MAG: hypothetical protein E7321_04020 [Clostridiales bacterium]|nr:hypothetical protein [Clostridiales bacterium]